MEHKRPAKAAFWRSIPDRKIALPGLVNGAGQRIKGKFLTRRSQSPCSRYCDGLSRFLSDLMTIPKPGQVSWFAHISPLSDSRLILEVMPPSTSLFGLKRASFNQASALGTTQLHSCVSRPQLRHHFPIWVKLTNTNGKDTPKVRLHRAAC